MWITKVLFVILLISKIECDEDEAAKVDEVLEDSTINYIKYSNNGAFERQTANLTNHRVASSQDQQMLTQCGGIFRNLQNLIESPKFISPRPICSLRCEYQVVSPYICENEFHVQFLDFALDSSPSCENDRVIINYSEVLCGKIIGVKKFRTVGGVLNITFSSRSWDLKQGKGFRLLVTRLPCVEESKENQTEVDSLEPSAAPGANEDRCYQVNSTYTVGNPSYNQGHPIYGVPYNYNRTVTINGRQDVPVIPLPTPDPNFPTQGPIYPTPGPIYPPTYPPPIYPPPILPPQFLPLCCRNNFNQDRFLLISQGFPSYSTRDNDCIFVIQRSSPSACRLRIIFKYFLLDDPQPGQFGCINNFIEIDGQRICGCRTNFVYETQWGFEPKVIRMRTVPGAFQNAQGFVLDVMQEACPFKLQDNRENFRQKRFLQPERFMLHPFLRQGHNHGVASYPSLQQAKTDIDEKLRSKFFNAEQNNFARNVCVMNHLTLFRMKLETIGVTKQYCLPISPFY